jgi:CRP/FNR family transcriptional regulator, cyclic AMP receptor protein
MTVAELWTQSSLSAEVAAKLFSIAREIRYDEDEYIVREGDHALYLFIVRSGRVGIEVSVKTRAPVTLMTIGPGEWFSWSALLEPRIERASARAVEPTVVWAVRGGAVMDLALEDHEFGFQIYRALAELVGTRLTHSWLQLLQTPAP